jgi:hypothetical protein
MTITTPPGQALTPPRAAAVAGVIFSILFLIALAIVRLAADTDRISPGGWMADPQWRQAVRFALNLVPFSGIAFLWLLAVLRSRLGALEDQFFATVLLGSGLLFVATLFAAAAVVGSLIGAVSEGLVQLPKSETYEYARRFGATLMNVFVIKMAGVFTFSTCTIALRTRIFPRWVSFTGFACGLVLLLVITNWPWIALLFPLWILLVSSWILLADLLGRRVPTS